MTTTNFYPDSLRTTKEALSNSQKTFEDFKNSYKLAKNSFVLPGLGESKDSCMSLRAKAFAKNGEAIKYENMKCKKVECPKCWTDWARKRVFDIVLKIEAFAKANNERPYFAVCSVPPSEAKDWNWNRLNESLFRRSYRRLSNIGITGGFALFHPFRLKRRAKKQLKDKGWGSGKMDAGYWKGVRDNALDFGNWSDYVRFSPHLHTIVFGEPEKHECDDFFIGFKDSNGKPESMGIDRIIGYCFYLITHVGVGEHFQTKVSRSFGNLYNINPEELLTNEEYNELAEEIADKIDMNWDSDTKELVYSDDSNSEYEWVSIWKLKEYLNSVDKKEWRSGISDNYKEFLEILWAWTWVNCNPPPLEEMLDDHRFYDVDIVCEKIPDADFKELVERLSGR